MVYTVPKLLAAGVPRDVLDVTVETWRDRDGLPHVDPTCPDRSRRQRAAEMTRAQVRLLDLDRRCGCTTDLAWKGPLVPLLHGCATLVAADRLLAEPEPGRPADALLLADTARQLEGFAPDPAHPAFAAAVRATAAALRARADTVAAAPAPPSPPDPAHPHGMWVVAVRQQLDYAVVDRAVAGLPRPGEFRQDTGHVAPVLELLTRGRSFDVPHPARTETGEALLGQFTTGTLAWEVLHLPWAVASTLPCTGSVPLAYQGRQARVWATAPAQPGDTLEVLRTAVRLLWDSPRLTGPQALTAARAITG